MSWTLVAETGSRELWVDFSSRIAAGVNLPGSPGGCLVKAATMVDGDWREQTIWEPNLLARRQSTLERRLREWPADRLTPQKLTAP